MSLAVDILWIFLLLFRDFFGLCRVLAVGSLMLSVLDRWEIVMLRPVTNRELFDPASDVRMSLTCKCGTFAVDSFDEILAHFRTH